MRDPAFRDRLLAEKSDRVAGDGTPVPPLADKLLEGIEWAAMRFFRIGEQPDYEAPRSASLFGEALTRGLPPLRVVYDALLEEDGAALLYFPLFNYSGGNLDVVHELLGHPLVLAALSDGGAHCGTVCDASFPTFTLAHWSRDRAARFPVETIVHLLTGRNAAYAGLSDRGAVREGLRADLNVIDHAALGLAKPRLVRDLPAGGKRFLQDARGYRATIVGGVVTLADDRLTGATPGRVARLGPARDRNEEAT
jgi:N-acyl-D-aspartate/D-glutamate deacylase